MRSMYETEKLVQVTAEMGIPRSYGLHILWPGSQRKQVDKIRKTLTTTTGETVIYSSRDHRPKKGNRDWVFVRMETSQQQTGDSQNQRKASQSDPDQVLCTN